MSLSETGNDRLVRLCVVVSLEARIFIVQTMQSLLQLFLVTSRRRVHREYDTRLGECDFRKTHRMLTRRERIVRVSVLELGHASDIAGMKEWNLDTVFSLRNREMCQLLRVPTSRVEDFMPVVEHTRERAEEAHVADMRLRVRLE